MNNGIILNLSGDIVQSVKRLLFSHHANIKYKQTIKAMRRRLSQPAREIFIFLRSMEISVPVLFNAAAMVLIRAAI
jgi:hypothetical protein